MDNYIFSVLMSVYFKEKPLYLDLALESVFNQTIKPNEVILVEGGSLTEELEEVISKYEKKYSDILKVIKYEKNRGLGIALHDGLLECSNDIVFRMDTDDICVNDRFEKQLEVFKNNVVDVVGSNICEYDDDMENMTGMRIVPENDRDIKKMAKKRNPMNHMTVAYRKQAVIEVGNYQDMAYFEDYYPTVIFDYGDYVESTTVAYKDYVNVPSDNKDNGSRVIVGWSDYANTNPNDATMSYNKPITEDTTIYAIWDTYETVTIELYDENSPNNWIYRGSIKVFKKKDSQFPTTAELYDLCGRDFDGVAWYTDKSQSATSYVESPKQDTSAKTFYGYGYYY